MINKAIKQITEFFKVKEEEVLNIKRFDQGMSNYTYYFEVMDEAYVIRLIGLGAEKYVDYKNEHQAIKIVQELNISSKLVYFDEKTGTKIVKYLNGQTNKKTDINLVNALKKLHNIKSNLIGNYNLVERLNLYESYNYEGNISNNYYEIKNWWIKVYNKYYQKGPKVLCHNDLQNINIIRNNDDVYLIDFEYVAYNDLFYDFASYEDDPFLLYELYFNKKIDHKNKNHIIFYKIYQSLQWYQVAKHKDEIGFSKLTNYNFKELEDYFINDALTNYNKLKGEIKI